LFTENLQTLTTIKRARKQDQMLFAMASEFAACVSAGIHSHIPLYL